MPTSAGAARFYDFVAGRSRILRTPLACRGRRIPALTALSAYNLAAALYPVTANGWAKNRAKYLARVVLNPRQDQSWRNFLVGDMGHLWTAQLRLALKVHRSYLRRGLSVTGRMDILMSHYTILREVLSPDARAEIYCDGLTLLRLADENSGRLLDVRLVYSERAEKEGELTLVVQDVGTGVNLISLTFCLNREGGERVAWLGGLQSMPGEVTRALIHDVTKELHGLRPKALALWCVRELAEVWSVKKLRAVADMNHATVRSRSRRRFTTSYDEFWAECGGTMQPDGNWELPLQMAIRPRAELKPSRRKAHELRYAMLGSLRPALHGALASIAPGTALDREWQTFKYRGARARVEKENTEVADSSAPALTSKSSSSRKVAAVA